MRSLFTITFALSCVLVHGCSCDEELYSTEGPPPEAPPPPPPPGAQVGSIGGCVCDDTAGAWVDGATVFVITSAGAILSTQSDEVGCFVLADVPAGAQTLAIERGTFFREHVVNVVADARVDIVTPATCEPAVAGDTGTVAGRVCAPDGETWLAAADVYVELDGGERVETETDSEGRYTLAGVPVGEQTVHIEKGPFSTARTVTVVANQTTTIAEDECALDTTVSIAIVTGNNDDVRVILDSIGVDAASITEYRGHQGFGVDSTAWGEDLLGDYATLSRYDIVFINCGANGIDDYPLLGLRTDVVDNETYVASLRQFVAEGGSVYASDEAYDLIEKAWPEAIDFYGDDDTIDAAQIGVQETDAMPVDIVDASLAAAMGQSVFDIHFNYTLWAIVDDVAADTDIYTRGDAPTSEGVLLDMPLTVGFSPGAGAGAGRVIYTSFHQEPGVDSATARLLQLLMFEL